MPRPLFVGIAPLRAGDPPFGASTPSGRFLADLVGVLPHELPRLLDLRNLCAAPAPSRSALAVAAAALRVPEGAAVVLAGTEVVRAFGRRARPARDPDDASYLEGLRYFEWYDAQGDFRAAVVRMPSPHTPWYNRNRHRALPFFRALAEGS